MSSIAKSCATVGELRSFLRGIPNTTPLHTGLACLPRVVVHFKEPEGGAMQVDFEVGEEIE